ncbi:hypothetical protein QCA50_006855 [Cerrena zonata]|uniref:Uncharacterized protein n=1 Tax=Cerrena zonata TaxID=2478898 RepID=A0AAW0GKN9_9APHY
MAQFPIDRTFAVAFWLEAVLYGFYLCLFCVGIYVNNTFRRKRDTHSQVLFIAGIVMFFMATFHLSLNCYRYLEAYVTLANVPGASLTFLADLPAWHQILKDVLYGTQELFGDIVAIYRCYVIWGRNWKIIILPCLLSIGSAISGYGIAGIYATRLDSTDSIFTPAVQHWIQTFYSLAVVQSALITGLMAFRIWQIDHRSAKYRTSSEGRMMYVVRVLVESAGFLLMFEVILLGMYIANYNAQYILLDAIATVVGITFTAITIRATLHFSVTSNSQTGSTSRPGQGSGSVIHQPSSGHISGNGHSYPMQPISINITKDVHAQRDDFSDGDKIDYDVESGVVAQRPGTPT